MNFDGYFTRFGNNSPSLWWNKDELLDQAVEEIDNKYDNKIQRDILSTKVFLLVGELEGSNMLPTMVKNNKLIKTLNYENKYH